MHKLDELYIKGKNWLTVKKYQFFEEERGDVNIVSMVVLIGIAVLLAVLFKDTIKELLETLLETIKGNAQDAVS
ncbi:MAG: Flp1 family type IVb pilin [Roseburia sp.]